MALHPGQTFNNAFRVLSEGRRGGFATVYKAESIDAEVDDTLYALKITHEAVLSERVEALFRREAKRLRTLNHPAVVRCHGVQHADDGRLVMIMDWIDGPSLKEWVAPSPIAGQPMHQAALIALAQRLLPALDDLHAAGIIHRDLSPDNILLRDGDPAQPVLIDFGISKDMTPGTSTLIGDNFAGKLRWVAPEQLGLSGGTQAIGPATDLYAAALVLTFAALGRPLLDATDAPGAIGLRATVPELAGAGVPGWMHPALTAALAPIPADRPASGRALLDLLAAPVSSSPVAPASGATAARDGSTQAASPPAAPGKSRPRRGLMLLGLAALAAMAVAASQFLPPSEPAAGQRSGALDVPRADRGDTPPEEAVGYDGDVDHGRIADALAGAGDTLIFAGRPLAGGPAAASKLYAVSLSEGISPQILGPVVDDFSLTGAGLTLAINQDQQVLLASRSAGGTGAALYRFKAGDPATAWQSLPGAAGGGASSPPTSVAWAGQTAVIGFGFSSLRQPQGGHVAVLPPDQQQPTLVSPSSVFEEDGFGMAVAGHGPWFAVGAPFTDLDYANSGQVTLHRLDDPTRVIQTLAPPDPVRHGQFGRSLAMAGDWLAVGEPDRQIGELDQTTIVSRGRVHLYRLVQGEWTLIQSLRPARGTPAERFGASLAMDASGLLIGAPHMVDQGAGEAGAHYYRRVGDAWELARVLRKPGEPGQEDTISDDGFGTAVALTRQVLAVGAPDSSGRGPRRGALFLWQRD